MLLADLLSEFLRINDLAICIYGCLGYMSVAPTQGIGLVRFKRVSS